MKVAINFIYLSGLVINEYLLGYRLPFIVRHGLTAAFYHMLRSYRLPFFAIFFPWVLFVEPIM